MADKNAQAPDGIWDRELVDLAPSILEDAAKFLRSTVSDRAVAQSRVDETLLNEAQSETQKKRVLSQRTVQSIRNPLEQHPRFVMPIYTFFTAAPFLTAVYLIVFSIHHTASSGGAPNYHFLGITFTGAGMLLTFSYRVLTMLTRLISRSNAAN